MKIISHRGNLTEKIPKLENHPSYIKYALNSGYDVEIDVRYIDGQYFLGHDHPQYKINYEFLANEKFWVHCKDVNTFYKLSDHPLINAFYHNTDDVVLTTRGFFWIYPNIKTPLNNKSIVVLPELIDNWKDWKNIELCYGICTDKATDFKKLYK